MQKKQQQKKIKKKIANYKSHIAVPRKPWNKNASEKKHGGRPDTQT